MSLDRPVYSTVYGKNFVLLAFDVNTMNVSMSELHEYKSNVYTTFKSAQLAFFGGF